MTIFIKIHTFLHIRQQSYSFIYGTEEAQGLGTRSWRQSSILACWGFVRLIVNSVFLIVHCDLPHSPDSFICFTQRHIPHLTHAVLIKAVVLCAALHHSPVISFPFPCCMAAQRIRTDTRGGILTILLPDPDGPFLLFCLCSSWTRSSSLPDVRIKGGSTVSMLAAGGC